jgi:hypothetical protein
LWRCAMRALSCLQTDLVLQTESREGGQGAIRWLVNRQVVGMACSMGMGVKPWK